MFCLKPRQSPLAPRCFLYWYTKLLSYQAYFVTHLPTIWPPLIKQESLVPSRSIIKKHNLKKHVHIFVTGDVIHFESSPILEAGHMSWCHDDVYEDTRCMCPSAPPAPLSSLCHYHCHQCQWHHCVIVGNCDHSHQVNKQAVFLHNL